MDSRLVWELLAILALILANGFFALAEFSVIASRKGKLLQKVEEKKAGAKRAARLHDDPERFLATIQVGITMVAVMVGVFSGATIVDRLAMALVTLPIDGIESIAGPLAMVLIVIIITFLSVVIGELVPKYLALSFPERYARYISGPITVFIRFTSVFSRLLSGTAALIVRMLGVRTDVDHGVVSEDEINQMVIEGRKEGVFDDTEQAFIHAVFEFADATVRRAMTPRTDVIGIDINAKPEEILKQLVELGYSRYPIFQDNLDNIIGVLYTKDILTKNVDPHGIDLKALMREPLFVPDSMPPTRLLKVFQKGESHLAVVLDEFGGTAGIITLEDLIEELVGEIQDEYDAEAAPLVKHSDTIVYADSAVWPGEVNELLGTHLPEENVDTLAGVFMDAVGHLPERHESVQIADVRLTVLALDENRVKRFKLEKTDR